VLFAMAMPMFMTVRIAVMRMLIMRMLYRLARRIFFPVTLPLGCEHVYFGRDDSTASHLTNLQPRSDIQGRHALFQHARLDPRVDQRAQEHIAANAGKTIEIRDAHKLLWSEPAAEAVSGPDYRLETNHYFCL
jgi:hypothetical protein